MALLQMEPLRFADHLVSSVGEHPQGRKFDFAGQNVQTLPAKRGYCPAVPWHMPLSAR